MPIDGFVQVLFPTLDAVEGAAVSCLTAIAVMVVLVWGVRAVLRALLRR